MISGALPSPWLAVLVVKLINLETSEALLDDQIRLKIKSFDSFNQILVLRGIKLILQKTMIISAFCDIFCWML